jgi:hypothetical protein
MQTIEPSKTVKRQVITLPSKLINYGGYKKRSRMFVSVRWDDQCGNGRNSFAITADIKQGAHIVTCGCLHELIAKHFPEVKHLIKYHLCNADMPLHYKANTKYHAANGQLESARNCAIWQDATLEQLLSDEALDQHLAELMPQFKNDLTNFGLTW